MMRVAFLLSLVCCLVFTVDLESKTPPASSPATAQQAPIPQAAPDTPPQFALTLTKQDLKIQGTTELPLPKSVTACFWTTTKDWASDKETKCPAPDPSCKNANVVTNQSNPAGSIKNDGTFSIDLGTCMFPKEIYVSISYQSAEGKAVLSVAVSPLPDVGSNASPPKSTPNPILNLSLHYCDQSLPYAYSDAAKGNVTVESTNVDGNWVNWLNIDFNTNPKNPTVTFIAQPPGKFTNSGANDPVLATGQFNDAGFPSLGADPSHAFSGNTADAQRLAVRTLYGPNFANLACDYAYLSGPAPTDLKQEPADFYGKAEDLTTGSSGKAATLRGNGSPLYYVFNVVRWQDVTQPPASSNGAPPTKTIPLYQAASDEWYLLNYADLRDYHRDLRSLFHRFEPQYKTATMQILGSSNVMFIAIHLAPPAPAALGTPPQRTPGGLAITGPTEQAW